MSNSDTGQKQSMNKRPDSAVVKQQKLYVRDLSFENFLDPDTPMSKLKSPKLDIEIRLDNRELHNDIWEVVLRVNATMSQGDGGSTIYIVEIEHCGLFLIKNVPVEHLPRILSVDCPAFIFPFTRSIVAHATREGGFPPLYLDPINFAELYMARLRQQ